MKKQYKNNNLRLDIKVFIGLSVICLTGMLIFVLYDKYLLATLSFICAILFIRLVEKLREFDKK